MAKRRSDEADEKPMVTLVDATGAEFTTGDLRTVNSLCVQGYRPKSGTVAEALATLAPAPADGDGDGGQ